MGRDRTDLPFRSLAALDAVIVLLITWLPEDQAGRVTGVVAVVARWLSPLVPFDIGYVVLEFLANVALFVPLGGLVALGWPRIAWWRITLFGLAFSALIELVQMWLPSRFPTVSDVIANTLGAMIGAACVVVARALFARGRSSLDS